MHRCSIPDDNSVPVVSIIIPVYNEEPYLPATLRSIQQLETKIDYEVIVVDGGSDDDSRTVAENYGVALLDQDERGIGDARDTGASHARGEWFAFVDADTTLRPSYLDAMVEYAERHSLIALSSRCRIVGTRRAKPLEFITNHFFPRNDRPMLPGFNTFVRRKAYRRVGGYANVPNEDKALSRALATVGPTGFHPSVLVETSARRIERDGLVWTVGHYLRLDIRTIRSDEAGDDFSPPVRLALGLTLLGGLFQLYHGIVLGHTSAVFAATGFFGGATLFVMDISRQRLLLYGVIFVVVQITIWSVQGLNHGFFGILNYSDQAVLGAVLTYLYVLSKDALRPLAWMSRP